MEYGIFSESLEKLKTLEELTLDSFRTSYSSSSRLGLLFKGLASLSESLIVLKIHARKWVAIEDSDVQELTEVLSSFRKLTSFDFFMRGNQDITSKALIQLFGALGRCNLRDLRLKFVDCQNISDEIIDPLTN